MSRNMQQPQGSKSTQGCPEIDDLVACLDPLADDAQVARHLEHCDNCRQILDSLAGQPVWWESAQASLSTADGVEVARSTQQITKSICALSQDHSESVRDPLREHEVQNLQALLDTPSHPELLARLGRYELEQLVGRGGMGLVFRGFDTELHRVVAVKTLAVHLLPIRSARERFIREARACAALSHPHIVPIYDVLTDGPVPALVMQYIAGPTLESWIEQQGALPISDALQLTCQLADALAAAHDHGLVHRDIKPGNILLEANASRALLTDFGLVRTLDEASLTHSGTLAGTPDFMAPEQARGENTTEQSDLFSLGATLFCMLTGRPPFRDPQSSENEAPSPMAVLHRVCSHAHPNLNSTQSNVPYSVSKLVDQMLAKTPAERPRSAAHLKRRCQEMLTSRVALGQGMPAGSKLRQVLQDHAWGILLAATLCLTLFSLAWLDQSGRRKDRQADFKREVSPSFGKAADIGGFASLPDAPSPRSSLDSEVVASHQRALDKFESQVDELSSELSALENFLPRTPAHSGTPSRWPESLQAIEAQLLLLELQQSTRGP